jgi:hypothetical protein
MPSELKITMLGHRGVGKTSILTAMYEQFESTIGETGLQLTPDAESSALLSKRLGELKALLNDFEAAGGLEGTEEPQSFKFGLGFKIFQVAISKIIWNWLLMGKYGCGIKTPITHLMASPSQRSIKVKFCQLVLVKMERLLLVAVLMEQCGCGIEMGR